MQSIICFVSDFGLEDAWVGVCKAVIFQACPQTRVVDLAHQIPPFDLRKAAAVAAVGVYQLPEAIHLVVVDPGVGGGRSDLCIVTNNGTRLVGPDNGVLLPAAHRAGGIAQAYAMQPDKIDFTPPLPTFHARDVLAPAAAALACGVEPSSLGTPCDEGALVQGPFNSCEYLGGHVQAEVVDIDRFGTVRVNVDQADIERLGLNQPRIEMSFGHTVLEVILGRTFSDVARGEPIALVDSSGWLALAIREGSAAERYGIEPGVTARIRPLDD